MKIPDSNFFISHLIAEMTEPRIIRELKKISENFTKNRKAIGAYVESPEMISAYSCFYLPTNISKFEFLIDKLPEEIKADLAAKPFVDIGTGPATYIIAFYLYFKKIQSDIFGIDSSKLMLQQARKILEALDFPMNQVHLSEKVPLDLQGGTLCFGNSLNEMGLEKGKNLIKRMKPDHVIFIEPGTKESWAQMKMVRVHLKSEGFQILYPCPSSEKECPVKGEDWCHQVIRTVHGPETERLGQLASMDRKTMPVIAHFYTRRKVEPSMRATLFRFLRETKHSFEWQVCLAERSELVTFEVSKRGMSKKEQKSYTKLNVGISLEFDVIQKVNEEFWKVVIK